MIEITRSYSRTIQLEPYEPLSVFMSAKTEIDDSNVHDIEILSKKLYNICKDTVDSDIKEAQEN